MDALRRRELTSINRWAMQCTPKLPYIAWANNLDTTGPRFDDTAFDTDGPAVFLIPNFDDFDDAQAFMHANFNVFFEHWLHAWCTDASRWPSPRTWQMFQAWFDWRVHSFVLDAADAPLA
jgi:hypothetical protein